MSFGEYMSFLKAYSDTVMAIIIGPGPLQFEIKSMERIVFSGNGFPQAK